MPSTLRSTLCAALIGAMTLGFGCDRSPRHGDRAGTGDGAAEDQGPPLTEEREPNDSIERRERFADGSGLTGTVSAGDEDWIDLAPSPENRILLVAAANANDSITAVAQAGGIRWTLGEASPSQPVRVDPATLPPEASLIIGGEGEWVIQSESLDAAADGTGSTRQNALVARTNCPDADRSVIPATAGAKATIFVGDEPANSEESPVTFRLCVNGQGAVALPVEWQGSIVGLVVDGPVGSELEWSLEGYPDPYRRVVAPEARMAIRAIRLPAGDGRIALKTAHPSVVRLQISPVDEETSGADVEPNDTASQASQASLDRGGRLEGELHVGESADWLTIPWADGEEQASLIVRAPLDPSVVVVLGRPDGDERVPLADDGSLMLCGLVREEPGSSVTVGVILSEPASEPIAWSMERRVHDGDEFEREPNDERLLRMELQAPQKESLDKNAALFVVPGRPAGTRVEGFVGARGDERDVIPLMVRWDGAASKRDADAAGNVSLRLRAPAGAALRLELIDADGALVARSLDGGAGAVETVRASLPDGVYHAVVGFERGDGCSGTYTLSLDTARDDVPGTVDDGDAHDDDRDEGNRDEVKQEQSERSHAPPPPLRRE